jgi:hypothetical protein
VCIAFHTISTGGALDGVDSPLRDVETMLTAALAPRRGAGSD